MQIVWVRFTDYASRSQDLWSLLTEKERFLVDQFKKEDDRQCKLVSYALLKVLLAERTGKPISDIYITREKGKKPYQEGLQTILFNVSHSGEWCCFAFSDTTPIGVDIEEIRPFEEMDFVADMQFSKEEKISLATAADKTLCFYTIWCRKEAYLKAIGTGIRTELNKIDTTQGKIQSWKLETIAAPQGYCAVLASYETRPCCIIHH